MQRGQLFQAALVDINNDDLAVRPALLGQVAKQQVIEGKFQVLQQAQGRKFKQGKCHNRGGEQADRLDTFYGHR